MAKTERTPRQGKVKEIVAALVNSEIPEIRTIIGELTECTKQLEERSQKLQSYAVEIQQLTGEEVEVPVETNLEERLRSLEKTLAGLAETTRVPAKLKEVEEKAGERGEVAMPPPSLMPRVETYITPEGFVVRRRRY